MERLFLRNVLLKNYCTWRVGGPARFFYEPRDAGELKKALVWAHAGGTPVFVLGRGSNLLISDKGYDGLVIRTADQLTAIRFDGPRAEAECGAYFGGFLEACADRGLSGLEDLYDIPGTVGGAVFMNAGAFETSVADRLVEVVSLDAKGVEHRRPVAELAFAYRDSLFRHNNETIVRACFMLSAGEPAVLRARLAETLRKRNDKQPPDRNRSCGSVFKRPPGGYAGTLIDKAGLKGLRIGGARVSEKHANFIINDNSATAADIAALIDKVRTRVHAFCGVRLETEVIYLGEF
ncbi:MAG: UDP-N-acetylmuramate dehydrogenase [Fibrobacterota bacterium]